MLRWVFYFCFKNDSLFYTRLLLVFFSTLYNTNTFTNKSNFSKCNHAIRNGNFLAKCADILPVYWHAVIVLIHSLYCYWCCYTEISPKKTDFFFLLWCDALEWEQEKNSLLFLYDIIEFNDWQMYLGKLLYVHKNINIIMFVFRQKRGTRERMQPHPAPVLQPRGKNWPTNSTSVNEHLRPTTTRTG